jgi:hypothetical protein
MARGDSAVNVCAHFSIRNVPAETIRAVIIGVMNAEGLTHRTGSCELGSAACRITTAEDALSLSNPHRPMGDLVELERERCPRRRHAAIYPSTDFAATLRPRRAI